MIFMIMIIIYVYKESIGGVEDLFEEQDNWINEWEYPNIGIYFGNCPSGGHDMIALDYPTPFPTQTYI
jgi:hypothetical protein